MPKSAISAMHGCRYFVFMRSRGIFLVTSQSGFFRLPQLSSHAGNFDTVIINRLFSVLFKKQRLYFYVNKVDYTLAYS